MDIIAMAAFAASVNKTSAFKLRDEFPYLRRHTAISILLGNGVYSLGSPVWLSTGSLPMDG